MPKSGDIKPETLNESCLKNNIFSSQIPVKMHHMLFYNIITLFSFPEGRTATCFYQLTYAS